MSDRGDLQVLAADGPEAAPSAEVRRHFLVLMFGAAALYALGLSDHWRFQRDSVLYMGLARSLAETGTYSFGYSSHALALPGFPAMLSVLYMTVGHSFLAMNALVALFGLGCIALGYVVFRRLPLSDAQVLTCLLLLGFSRTLYYYSAHIMSDVPFTFFVLAGLCCGMRMLLADGAVHWGWCATAAAAAWAATSVRPLGPALLAGFAAGLWLRPGALKRWRPNLAGTALLLVPVAVLTAAWLWRSAHVTGFGSGDYYSTFIGRFGVVHTALRAAGRAPAVIEALPDAVLGVGLPLPVGVLLLVPMAVGGVGAVRRGERLVSAYGVAYLAGICLGSPGRRYLLPALPVLLYWLVLGVGMIGATCAGRRKAVTPLSIARIGAVLLLLAVAVNVMRVGKVIYEQRSPRFYEITEDGRLPGYFALCVWLQHNAGPQDVVVAYEYRLVHYLSRAGAAPMPEDWTDWTAVLARTGSPPGTAFYFVRDHGRDTLTARVTGRFESEEVLAKVASFGDGNLDLYRFYPEKLLKRSPRRRRA